MAVDEKNDGLKAALLAALERSIAAPSWFVVCWSALQRFAGAVAGHQLDEDPVSSLRPWPIANMRQPSLEAVLADLRATNGIHTKVAVARVLKRLDQLLGEVIGENEPWGPLPGINSGDYYWIAGRVDPGDFVSEREQAAGLMPFTPLLMAIPTRIDDVDVALHRPSGATAAALVELVATQAEAEAPQPIRLMAGTPTREFGEALLTIVGRPDLVKVVAPKNDGAIARQLLAIVARARRARASVLVLPELTVSAAARVGIEQFLARAPGFPAITAFGMVHEDDPAKVGGVTYRNLGVVLGPDGTEILRHEKLTTVAVHGHDLDMAERPAFVTEATAIGSAFAMVLTPYGWICVVVCLDLFHSRGRRVLEAAGPRLVLVPSLSDKTSPHERVAGLLAGQHSTVTIVANRPLKLPPGHLRAALDAAPHILWRRKYQDGHVAIVEV